MTDNNQTEEKAADQATNNQANAAIFQRLPLLGQIAWLYSQSIHHKHLFIGDIDWLIIPPLMLDQCKLYMNDNTPVAFVSWAYLNPDAEARFLENGIDRIPPKDWNNGQQAWLIDIVAPFGGIKDIIDDLKDNQFKGQTVKMVMPDEEKQEKQVLTLVNGEKESDEQQNLH